ncbi:magnesium/cobalt transporter CorA [Botrimarina sp.]|uniref:magnesium/cobalt transporter CorA n=1 Tax=Botrimarina sp. TaxID=2795802 RepID=UPI0032EEB1D0
MTINSGYRRLFRKRRPKVGSRPGTLVIPREAPPPQIHTFTYNADSLREADPAGVEGLAATLADDSVTWVDVQGFGDHSLMNQIGDFFGLHPLLLEDVVNVPQRPRTEAYDDQVLVIVRMVRVDEASAELNSEQVAIVFSERWVLTFQEKPGDILDPVRRRLRSGKGLMRTHGAAYLAYAIADTIIDGYFPVLESIGELLEGLDEEVLTKPTSDVLHRLNAMKHRLAHLRRWLWAQREAVDTLMRDEHPLVTDELRVYLRDTHGHCVHTAEIAEMHREMATGLMNNYLSSIANRTNEAMRVLTVMASIFIPLTFLAGVYGMNFEYMPELHLRWAYPAVWVAMIATAAGMGTYFWRKGWLGGR